MDELWQPDLGIDITAHFKGITTPLRDLTDEIHKNGWTLTTVKFKKDQFEAQAKNPHGETKVSYGNTEATAVANLLTKIIRTEFARSPALSKVANWDAGWEDQLAEIAKAYAEAPIYDPKAASAWQDLGNDCIRRARVLHTQLKVEVTDDPVPYKSMQDLIEDVTKKKHILLSRANADHPVWSMDQVLAYRLVHDVLGHVVTGGDWGWHGENMATQAHLPLVGIEAQKALFTEAIGTTAYGVVYRSFGPQKIAILKNFIEEAQDQFNSPGHGSLHPSQSIVPTEVPSIEPSGPSPGRSSKRLASPSLKDPNHGWSSGVAPLPDNAFLWHREENGLDPLDAHGAQEALANLDTGWQNLAHPDGSQDSESQRQAVVNALRSTILRPRKPEKWAAIHYQHVLPLPAGVQDPRRFHDTLDMQREEWNQRRGQAEGAHHAPYWGELQRFKGMIKALNPGLDDREINRRADQEFGHMWNEEEERILNDDKDSVLGANAMAALVRQNMKKRLGVVTKPKVDQDHDFGDVTLYHQAHGEQDPELYQDWTGNSLNTLAQVGRYSRELAEAARADYMHHGGKGHHFRKEALSLGIPGLGPSEVSQAWLHLAPHTSQLGVIDPHMLDILGHTPEEMNDRDYFKFERELAAGRDAAGYGHVPLGAFGHALWNKKNYGDHADYSHFRALNPTDFSQADLQRSPQDSWGNPEWWAATQDARDQTGEQWRRTQATQYPSSVYPFQTALEHTAATQSPTPWFIHSDTGEMVQGDPGQSLMNHLRKSLGVSTQEAWQLPVEAGKL